MKGELELDPETWAVNCSTSFAKRNSKIHNIFICVSAIFVLFVGWPVGVYPIPQSAFNARFFICLWKVLVRSALNLELKRCNVE